ncbi:MAG TPA: phosphate ABC transporter permease PstA [Armatimonadota bacterium]
MSDPIRRQRNWRYFRRMTANRLLWVGAILATLLAAAPLFLVLYYVVVQGLPAINWAFFTQLPKPVGEPGGGMANAIVGTLILVGLASLFGLPFGILGGIFLAEFGNNKIGNVVRFTADVLASVPSIVVGVLVYGIIVMPLKHFSALAGGVALGIMMIPTVMRTTEELVRLVPVSQRESALSLGATRFTTVFTVVMAAARGGVITGILLAVARVAGETAPLLFTALGNRFFSVSLDQPIASLPVDIYTRAIAPYPDWHAQAWAGGLVLVSMILILSVAARYATRGRFRLVR